MAQYRRSKLDRAFVLVGGDHSHAPVLLALSRCPLQGVRGVDTFTQVLSKVDRAILDCETESFVRVHVGKGTDEIAGAKVVAAHAGDLIGKLTLTMKAKVGLKTIGATIHPYPTQAEAIRKTGDLYNRTRLTPFVKNLMNRWLTWQRRGE